MTLATLAVRARSAPPWMVNPHFCWRLSRSSSKVSNSFGMLFVFSIRYSNVSQVSVVLLSCDKGWCHHKVNHKVVTWVVAADLSWAVDCPAALLTQTDPKLQRVVVLFSFLYEGVIKAWWKQNFHGNTFFGNFKSTFLLNLFPK